MLNLRTDRSLRTIMERLADHLARLRDGCAFDPKQYELQFPNGGSR